MIQNHATLSEIRQYLKKKLNVVYSDSETSTMLNMIMEHLGYPHPESILNPHHQPGIATATQINEIVPDILASRPIQYILGETSFLDLRLHINENALIPRQETEELVHRIIKGAGDSPAQILDLCSGSGCIALALKMAFPEAKVSGLEISPGALVLARENGELNQLKVNWVKADLLHAAEIPLEGKYDLIVSNPPYVLMSEKALMEKNVLDFEPHSALFVENDNPLEFYRAIGSLSSEILVDKGVLWLEINERFGPHVSELLKDSGFKQITVHKDIHEKERFVEARK